jgi:chromosome segregation ATPase
MSSITRKRLEEYKYLHENGDTVAKKLSHADGARQQLLKEFQEARYHLDNERAKAAEVEQDLSKAQSLAAYLDTRVQYLQEETLRCVPNETYANLKKAHDILLTKSSDDESYKVQPCEDSN